MCVCMRLQECTCAARLPSSLPLPSPPIPSPVCSVGCAPGTFQSFAEEQLDSSTTLAYPTSAPCPLGHYQPLPSQRECLPCPVGSFTPLLGQVECQLCPTAEYQDEEGQVICKACPTGYLTETEGANSSGSCYCVGDSCVSQQHTHTCTHTLHTHTTHTPHAPHAHTHAHTTRTHTHARTHHTHTQMCKLSNHIHCTHISYCT